jgi:acetylglutamate kinase
MSFASERYRLAAEQASTVSRALPYLRRYAGATIVVKYGGHAMGDESLAAGFGRDIAALKQVGINPVVVHGGGPQINTMLQRLKIQSTFVDGLRVTDAEMVEVVEMVLAGSVNKHVASLITQAGALAVGICGKDGGLIRARKLTRVLRDPDSNIERALDLGYVGEPSQIDIRVIHALTGAGLIPVIAPVGIGDDGETYNINAGIASGMITGGMIPKVENCVEAVRGGVKGATILDGRVEHACLLELFTEGGVGTMILG